MADGRQQGVDTETGEPLWGGGTPVVAGRLCADRGLSEPASRDPVVKNTFSSFPRSAWECLPSRSAVHSA